MLTEQQAGQASQVNRISAYDVEPDPGAEKQPICLEVGKAYRTRGWLNRPGWVAVVIAQVTTKKSPEKEFVVVHNMPDGCRECETADARGRFLIDSECVWDLVEEIK